MTLQLEIVTPEKVVYKEEVNEAIIPTIEGEVTILPSHVALISKISEGEITIKKNGKTTHLAITGGFLEVNNNKVTILADYAIRSEEIETAKATEAKKRAEKIMQEKVSEKDFAEAEAQLRRSLLELKVAERRRKRPMPPTGGA